MPTNADLNEHHGCTDGNCVFGHPGGMHTNGGCKCIPSLTVMHQITPEERLALVARARSTALMVRRFRDELRKRRAQDVSHERTAEAVYRLLDVETLRAEGFDDVAAAIEAACRG